MCVCDNRAIWPSNSNLSSLLVWILSLEDQCLLQPRTPPHRRGNGGHTLSTLSLPPRLLLRTIRGYRSGPRKYSGHRNSKEETGLLRTQLFVNYYSLAASAAALLEVGADRIDWQTPVFARCHKQRNTPKYRSLCHAQVCETRTAKTFAKLSYNKGVVIARCPGCHNLHLIADRLG